jgi:hypothetical protein
LSNEYKQFKKILKLLQALYKQRKSLLLWLRILIDKCIELELNSIVDEFCLFSNDNEILMFFYVNDIVFAFTASREKNAKNLIRRLKNIFDMRNLNLLNFFLDVRILQKLDMIWLIQNFYMNKLIKNYVINIEYKTTTFLSYQSLMSYIDDVNQERIHIYRQKVESICYFVIIIRSNIIKTAFELTRHFINFNSKHLKAANHCIKYLHVIKFLIIRYSNSENEEFSNQISSSNKKSRIKKCHQRRIRSWIKRRHRTKRTTINRFLRKQLMLFLQMILIEKTLKNTSSNYLMIWSTELSKNNSSSRFSSSKRNFFRCCMLTKSWFDEYISFRSWNLTRIKK